MKYKIKNIKVMFSFFIFNNSIFLKIYYFFYIIKDTNVFYALSI